MPAFVYDALPMRVVFGPGSLSEIAAETERLGVRRVLILSTPEQRELADRVAILLGSAAVGIFDQARMHVPTATVDAAAQAVTDLAVDGCVAVGGGSTIGLSKGLSLRLGLPSLAVPTTYAGSEMTPIWGFTKDGRKQTGRDRTVLPRTVVYDPVLTLTLPSAGSGTSGLNALAHAVEALYAPDRSPVVAAMAEQGVRDLAEALPVIAQQPGQLDARTRRCKGHGCAVLAWAPPRWACTTSSATCLGACSTFRARRRTLWSCRSSQRTTWKRRCSLVLSWCAPWALVIQRER